MEGEQRTEEVAREMWRMKHLAQKEKEGAMVKRKTGEDHSQFEEDGVWIEQEETLQTALVSELNYTQISQNVNATDRCGE